MKTLFITLSLLFAAVAGTVYAANEKDPQVSEVRKSDILQKTCKRFRLSAPISLYT